MATQTLTPRDSVLAPGEIAPDFTLKDQARNDWTLSDAVKKGDVALCFFPMAFTGVCGTEMMCISRDLAAWTKKGAQVVGISCDSFAVLKAWTDAEGFKQPMLADMHRQVCKAYGLYWPDLNVAWRGTVVIGKSADGVGRVKWSQKREIPAAMNFDEVLQHLS
ncbi:MAG: redoxin domain-containing protein [Phycisphaeraceae bacterium]|nr:redoxin domain-containing protein [Phycisphaeraceae bacterium]